jgi:glucosamine-6-phosphate deaminase
MAGAHRPEPARWRESCLGRRATISPRSRPGGERLSAETPPGAAAGGVSSFRGRPVAWRRLDTVRPLSTVAPDWWDYTTLDRELLDAAARLGADDLLALARPGFAVTIYDTAEEFYLAEALEYVEAWRQATPERPAGICGPIGPTEQLPLVARLVNELELDLRHAHFWAMDEWLVDGETVPVTHPLSFERADRELCFDRIRPDLRMPEENLHFPRTDLTAYLDSWEQARCVVMQGGQGEVKHWAFNDPVRRGGPHADAPPSPDEYRALTTRRVELHPMTLIQNARTSGGGVVQNVPTSAITVGPVETWKAERVSIWLNGVHDNPFGMRLTTLMLSERIADSAVPMSLLADHPDVRFSFLRPAIGVCDADLH